MKVKYYLSLLLSAILLSPACVKENNGRNFEMAYDNLLFTMPAGLNPFEIHYFVLRDIPLNKVFYFEQNNVTDQTKWRIKPHAARLQSVFGSVDYNFIEEAAVVIFTEEQPNLNLELFFRNPVPMNQGPSLDLVPTLADIQSLLKTDKINLRVKLRLRNTTPEFVETYLSFKLLVEEI
ncbi:MAG: hypothetical protein IPI60_01515 [Saprospiraceae bacterium]|nr:hypothetical protein [Saprospiraceae bacterium]